MIEAAATAGTITQAFSWLPPQARSARLFGAAADLRPDTAPALSNAVRAHLVLLRRAWPI
jgi:hypothetical protein